MLQGRYIGRTQYDYQGMNIIHNKVYPIEVFPNCNGYPWVVKIYDDSMCGKVIKALTGQNKEKAWIPYNEYRSKYWVINTNINYELIGTVNQSLQPTARPLFPSF